MEELGTGWQNRPAGITPAAADSAARPVDLANKKIELQMEAYSPQTQVVEGVVGCRLRGEEVRPAADRECGLEVGELLIQFADVLQATRLRLSSSMVGVEQMINLGFEEGESDVRGKEEFVV